VVPGLICGFADRGNGRLLDHRAPVLTVADSCTWHGRGTNLSRQQSATTVGASTGQARACLAVPHRPQPRCRAVPASPSAASGVAHGSGGPLRTGKSSRSGNWRGKPGPDGSTTSPRAGLMPCRPSTPAVACQRLPHG
jgi:hypothetical protein